MPTHYGSRLRHSWRNGQHAWRSLQPILYRIAYGWLLSPGTLQINIEGDLVSRPYVEMACSMIQAFGGQARVEDTRLC